jgi:hypothetical protein
MNINYEYYDEPRLHGLKDKLSKDNVLYKNIPIFCKKCNNILCASNNEFMCFWVETGIGNFCLDCFSKIIEIIDDPDKLALRKDSHNASKIRK